MGCIECDSAESDIIVEFVVFVLEYFVCFADPELGLVALGRGESSPEKLAIAQQAFQGKNADPLDLECRQHLPRYTLMLLALFQTQ